TGGSLPAVPPTNPERATAGGHHPPAVQRLIPMAKKKPPTGHDTHPRPLSPRHRADLGQSGLTAATIAACGFYTEDDPAAVGRLLNWRGPARTLGSCLVIPFANPDGTRSGFARVKPDTPREKAGKPVKYETPKG